MERDGGGGEEVERVRVDSVGADSGVADLG